MPRFVLARSLLAAGLISSACHRERAPEPAAARQPAAASIPEVIQWFLGEQVRGPRTSNRGTNLGIVTLDVTGEAKRVGEPRPGSCAPGLTSFLPTPAGPWLGLDETGRLLRYAGERWSAVPATISLPPIRRLLALMPLAAGVELLVTTKQGAHEWLVVLTMAGDEITDSRALDPATLGDRHAALQRFNSSRCREHTRDCLHLTITETGTVLMREPELFDDRIEITTLGEGTVLDARYADDAGTKIDLLSTAACPPATEPSEQPETPP
jgi:hypothetical protein